MDQNISHYFAVTIIVLPLLNMEQLHLMVRVGTKGTFHLSELAGQPISIVMRILLLIKTNHLDQSNPKHYVQRRWFFSKTSWKKPISLPNYLVCIRSSRPVLTFGKRPKSNTRRFLVGLSNI